MAVLSRFVVVVSSLKAHRPLTSAAPVYRQLKRSFEPIHRWWACRSSLVQQEEKMTRMPKQWRSNTCSCGSGKPKSAQYDARGIFLTYTCEDCHDRTPSYRPEDGFGSGDHLLVEDQCSLLSVLLRHSIRLARARKCASSFMHASLTSLSELWRAAKRQSSASSR
jgi:hypothetical protein